MTTLSATIRVGTSSRADALARLHDQMRSSFRARTVFFAIGVIFFFALYVALDWPHLGSSARLHWDAECSICSDDPMPTAAQLAQGRAHIYDLAAQTQSNDPERVTEYFNGPQGFGGHVPLETVRRYYSQISFFTARLAFDTGRRWTGSPLGAVWFFQLSAMLAVSVSMALLLTFAVTTAPPGRDLPVRLGILLLVFIAISSQIIFLSIARQMLTETIGLLLWVPSILMLVAAVNPRRSQWLATLFAAGAGAGFFATIRARYNLGPAVALILPLVLLLHLPWKQWRRGWTRCVFLSLIAAAVFAALVAHDVHTYGPFFMPWVYNETLVRSTYLYFHADPPYTMFFVMLGNNLPLLLLPVTGVIAAFVVGISTARGDTVSPIQLRAARTYSAVALVAIAALVTLMARQAVAYQGRHLFALSAATVLVLFFTVGRVRWKPRSGTAFAAICLVVILFNLHSTFGPQRVTADLSAKPAPRQTLRQRWENRTSDLQFADEMLNGYYEWADVRRLHDPLITMRFLQKDRNRPLLVIDEKACAAARTAWFAKKFAVADIWMLSDGDDVNPAPVQAALSAGRQVYLYTPRSQIDLASRQFNLELVGVVLDSATIFRIK